jgi:Gpi18-like mannosyltransferase
MGFFEKQLTVWRVSLPFRLLASALTVLCAKLLASLIVYFVLDVSNVGTFWVNTSTPDRVQNFVFQSSMFARNDWMTVFLGWDSAWYLSILSHGYSFSTQSFSFFPGLPLFSSLINLLIQNSAASLVSCSLVFGILWVPLYQLVAELYINKEAAFFSALLFAFSPFVFLFTTVAYSEGLLLFWVLLAWLMFKRGKVALASASAAVAVLSRAVGILIIIPMIIETIKSQNHRVRGFVLCCLPILAFLAWLMYGQLVANDWLAFIHTTEWVEMYSFSAFVFRIVPQFGIQSFLQVPPQNYLTTLAIWGSIILPPFLIAKLAKTSKALMAYAVAYFVGSLVFGAMLSLPRFISILFPLWLTLTASFTFNRKGVALMAVVLCVFFLLGLYLWSSFLNGFFVA